MNGRESPVSLANHDSDQRNKTSTQWSRNDKLAQSCLNSTAMPSDIRLPTVTQRVVQGPGAPGAVESSMGALKEPRLTPL